MSVFKEDEMEEMAEDVVGDVQETDPTQNTSAKEETRTFSSLILWQKAGGKREGSGGGQWVPL